MPPLSEPDGHAPRSPRVLQLCSYLYVNAFHARCFEALSACGVEQCVVTPHRLDRRTVTLDPAIALHEGDRTGWSLVHKVIYGWKVRDHLRHIEASPDLERFELVHAHSLFADGLAAHRLARRRDLPLVVTVRGGDVALFPRVYPHWRARARAVLREAATVILVNPNYRERLERALAVRLDDARCAVIPNGADARWFELPERVPGPGPARRVVCTGKLVPRKNQLGLIDAVALARERSGEDFRLDLIGLPVGRYGRAVLERCAALPWARHVGTRSQTELMETYAEHDLFALASHDENFGIVYVEALLGGLPVLYTLGQGFDGWDDGACYGVGVDSRRCESIAEGLLRLASERDSVRAGRALAERLFRWPAIAERHRELYRDALDRR